MEEERQELQALMNLPVEETTQMSQEDRIAKGREDDIEYMWRHGEYVSQWRYTDILAIINSSSKN